MKLVLCGDGPLVGKTTLAKALEKEGWIHANHSLTLVRHYVGWMNKSQHFDPPLTVDQVYADKEKHRSALWTYSKSIGFNDPVSVGKWVDETLHEWYLSPIGTSVVFDNARKQAEGDYLRDIGFLVVKLLLGEEERKRRAVDMHRDYQAIRQVMESEDEDYQGKVDIYLWAHWPTQDQVAYLLRQEMKYGKSL